MGTTPSDRCSGRAQLMPKWACAIISMPPNTRDSHSSEKPNESNTHDIQEFRDKLRRLLHFGSLTMRDFIQVMERDSIRPSYFGFPKWIEVLLSLDMVEVVGQGQDKEIVMKHEARQSQKCGGSISVTISSEEDARPKRRMVNVERREVRVCHFYRRGLCKFGYNCKNTH